MRLGKLAAVVGVTLLVAGPALAQRQGFGFGMMGGGGLAGMLGQSKQLQDELKMDKDQIDKVAEAIKKVREDLRDEMAKLRDRETPREERAEIMKKVTEANDKALGGILKAEQTKRLKQIENQQAGVGLFSREDAVKALKLTDDQKEKVKTIAEDMQKDMRELFQGGGGGGFNPEAMKKMQGLRKEALSTAVKLLNDEQKKTYKDMTGEPFELQLGGFGGKPRKPDGKVDF